ncbi:S8/S53 family peptidase [Bradyrhizobium diazoefficiens]|nr:S8/S53 family peptidase [Bradyrhizobium diazoefficiens]QQN62188.1 S8/S53 family peptidase [Bradyrhizobium diazoefficiens]
MPRIADSLSIAAVAIVWCSGSTLQAAGLKIANRPSELVAVVPRPTATDVGLIKGVAELGAPQIVVFPKGTDIAQFVAEKCGRPPGNFKIHPVYEKILLERNAGLSPGDLHALPEQKALEVPACGKFVEDVTLPAPKGVEKLTKELAVPFDTGVFERVVNDPTLRRDVQQTYATAFTDNSKSYDTAWKTICSSTPNASLPGDIASCRNAVQIAAANPQITKPNMVKEVTVPALTQLARAGTDVEPKDVRIAIRTGVTEDTVRTAIPQLQNIEGQLKFVTEIEDVQQFGESCSKAAERKGDSWPYSVRDFLRVASLNGINQDQEGRRILIVDTGFDFSDPIRTDSTGLVFDPFYFHRLNQMSDPDPQWDKNEDGVKGNGGWAGVNLSGVNGRTSSATSIVFKHRSHGLSVAALALGGRPVEELRRVVHLPMRLGFASLVALDTVNPSINTGHIEKALRFAAAAGNEFNVVNLSLSSTDKIPGWDDIVSNKGKGRVFVVAAGNDGNKLVGKDAVYPAAFGGKSAPLDTTSGAVVSVGAHDADGKLALFSNKGLAVDVLAPGCTVPSYELRLDSDGRASGIVARNETGTSFSAPLVSFVAALLMNSPKLAGRPGLVKARIQMGSDYNWELRDDVYSSGILNIVKVLSVDNDILELADPSGGKSRNIRYGRLMNRSTIGEVECRAGDKLSFDTVKKVARNGTNDLLLFSNDDDTKPSGLERKFCDKSMLDQVVFEFRDVETGDTSSIPGSAVLDYVPAP